MTPASNATTALQLYTAEQAAALLQVSPWWLRKKATARAIPCTFIGRQLRFTARDLAEIIAAGSRPTAPDRRA
jgi:excisionase family DNA binding protein